MACFEPRRVEGIKLEITDAFLGCGLKLADPFLAHAMIFYSENICREIVTLPPNSSFKLKHWLA